MKNELETNNQNSLQKNLKTFRSRFQDRKLKENEIINATVSK